MSPLTIQVDEELKERLQKAAALHKRSAEDHARTLLQLALTPSNNSPGLGQRIRQRFANIDTSQLELPARDQPAIPAELPK
ncbi:plasmid stabilization protein [Pseudoduganella sp. FT55W]|uniref:Plasmid stabilization protein n=1 Tax=Duganella rivi TaxID=2666083 RepID=A0A7X4GNX6_9BURK|nr:plasmid stabilization protein [Duganella rivi]MYM66990.1 plasmid stabilization protein [Duganella rivi]